MKFNSRVEAFPIHVAYAFKGMLDKKIHTHTVVFKSRKESVTHSRRMKTNFKNIQYVSGPKKFGKFNNATNCVSVPLASGFYWKLHFFYAAKNVRVHYFWKNSSKKYNEIWNRQTILCTYHLPNLEKTSDKWWNLYKRSFQITKLVCYFFFLFSIFFL